MSFLYHYEQVFTEREVDEFVSRRLLLPFEKAVIRNRHNVDVEDTSKRKSERQYINFDNNDPFLSKLTSYISTACSTYYNRSDLWVHRPWELLKYHSGDFFGRHCDKINPVFGPFVSAVVYLNGTYKGGDVRLYHDQTSSDYTIIKQRPGFVLTYPSDTYHEVTKVTSGARLSLANFFGIKK